MINIKILLVLFFTIVSYGVQSQTYIKFTIDGKTDLATCKRIKFGVRYDMPKGFERKQGAIYGTLLTKKKMNAIGLKINGESFDGKANWLEIKDVFFTECKGLIPIQYHHPLDTSIQVFDTLKLPIVKGFKVLNNISSFNQKHLLKMKLLLNNGAERVLEGEQLHNFITHQKTELSIENAIFTDNGSGIKTKEENSNLSNDFVIVKLVSSVTSSVQKIPFTFSGKIVFDFNAYNFTNNRFLDGEDGKYANNINVNILWVNDTLCKIVCSNKDSVSSIIMNPSKMNVIIEARGKDGAQGAGGHTGSNERGDAMDGGNGYAGGYGGNGGNVTVFYPKDFGNYLSHIYIDNRGGQAGRGGAGGNGGSQYNANRTRSGISGQNGEMGQNGNVNYVLK